MATVVEQPSFAPRVSDAEGARSPAGARRRADDESDRPSPRRRGEDCGEPQGKAVRQARSTNTSPRSVDRHRPASRGASRRSHYLNAEEPLAAMPLSVPPSGHPGRPPRRVRTSPLPTGHAAIAMLNKQQMDILLNRPTRTSVCVRCGAVILVPRATLSATGTRPRWPRANDGADLATRQGLALGQGRRQRMGRWHEPRMPDQVSSALLQPKDVRVRLIQATRDLLGEDGHELVVFGQVSEVFGYNTCAREAQLAVPPCTGLKPCWG